MLRYRYDPCAMACAGCSPHPDPMPTRLPSLHEVRVTAVREAMTLFLEGDLYTGGLPSLHECHCRPLDRLTAVAEVLQQVKDDTLLRKSHDTKLPCRHAQELAREAARDPAQLAFARAVARALAGELWAKGETGQEELCACSADQLPCAHVRNAVALDLQRQTRSSFTGGDYGESKKPTEITETTPTTSARLRVIARRIRRHESCSHPEDIEHRLAAFARFTPRHRREGK